MGSLRCVHVLLTLLIIYTHVVAVPGSHADSQHQGEPETGTSELRPGVTLPLGTALPATGPGPTRQAEAGAVVRVHVVPRHRVAYVSLVFHSTRLSTVWASRGFMKDLLGPNTLEVCLHRNASMPLGACEDPSRGMEWGPEWSSGWSPVVSGNWSASVSPFSDYWLDIRARGVVGIPMPVSSANVTLTSSEEFEPHRPRFLLAGLALIHSAPLLATWVPLYYGSAMVGGVLAMVILNFSKMFPKVLWASFMYAVFGPGGLLLFSTMAWWTVGLTLLGALLGYWCVRLFVMGPTGVPCAAIVSLASVVLQGIGAVCVSQASTDPVFAVMAVILGFLSISFLCLEQQ